MESKVAVRRHKSASLGAAAGAAAAAAVGDVPSFVTEAYSCRAASFAACRWAGA